MSESFRQAVIETLTDRRMGAVNFGYGPTHVYPHGYGEVASLVRDGHIRFLYAPGGHNSFAVDTPLGEAHVWRVNEDLGEPDGNGGVQVSGAIGSSGRGTIVHEATHALQDFQRLNAGDRLGSSFTPAMAEGAAHIAGWIARFQWGWPRPTANDPEPYNTISKARQIADRLLRGRIVYQVPQEDYAAMNAFAGRSIGSAHRYVFLGFFPESAGS